MAFGMSAASASLVGGALSVGGSLLASNNASNAASSAADAQIQASNNSLAEQKRQFDIQQKNAAPFLQTGTAANKRLAQLLGIGTADAAPGPASTGVTFKGQTYGSIDELRDILQNDFVRQGGNPFVGDYQNVLSGVLSQATPVADAASSQPYTGADSGALLRTFTADDLAADPVYNSGLQFGLDTGTKAINARAIAGGGYDSGATLKALTQFGNDYGSTKAGDSYNRFENNKSSIYNKLAGVAGTGQTAVGQVNSASQNYANNASNLMTGAGNASAAGVVAGANAWQGAASGVNNAFTNYQSNQTLQALLARGGGQYSGYQYPGQYSTSNPQYG